MSDPDHEHERRQLPPIVNRIGGRAADAGLTLSGAVIGCLVLGYMLGEYFDANPAATMAGLLIGLVVGFYNLAKVMGLFG